MYALHGELRVLDLLMKDLMFSIFLSNGSSSFAIGPRAIRGGGAGIACAIVAIDAEPPFIALCIGLSFFGILGSLTLSNPAVMAICWNTLKPMTGIG